MHKKFLKVIMILVFVISQVFVIHVSNASDINTDFEIQGYQVSSSDINSNDEFSFSFFVKNNSSLSVGNMVLIIDQSSSFYASNGNSQVSLPDTTISKGDQHQVPNNPIKLKYKGDGKELKLSLKYDTLNGDGSIASSGKVSSFSIFIKEANPEEASTQTQTPVTTSNYKPILEIMGDKDIPVGEAGKKLLITLSVRNSGLYGARNLKVTLDSSDSAKLPFEIDRMNLTKGMDPINPSETKDVTFDLNVADNASSGNYMLKFNFTYTNPFNDPMTSSDTIYIKIINKNTVSQVVLSKVNISSQPVTPGSNVSVSFLLKNVGNTQAHDVKTTIKGLDGNAFTLLNTTDVQHLGDMDGLSTTAAKYTLAASDNISTGRYALSVRLDYTSSDGKTYSEDNQFYLRVEKPVQDEALLTMEPVEVPTDPILAGSNFKIAYKISNLSKTAAKNIKVSISNDKEIISKSLSTIVIDSLDGKSEKVLEFEFSSASDSASKNYPIGLTLEYDSVHDGKTVRNSLSEYAGVYIQSPAKKETLKTVPRLIINSYNFGGSSKKAGETFDVLLSFLNTSRDIPIRNLKITFSSDDGTFSILGSNSFYVDYLDTKQSIEKSIKLSAKPDATPKAYPLSINFEYEDKNGTQYTSKETISIPINQDLRFVIGDLNTSPEAYAGQQAPLNIQFYNMGKTTLYNLMVKVEGDFDGQKPSYYVGNFDAGKSDSFDGAVTPKAPGQAKGSIVFTYEDASGKQTIVRKDFVLNVVQMQMPDKTANMDQPNADGQKKSSKKFLGPLSLLQVILIGAGIVVVIVVAVILRKRKKRKMEMMLDELL